MGIDLSNKKAFMSVGALLFALFLFVFFDGQTLLYLFYLRVPLLSGLLLFSLPAICIYGLPSLLGNLFVLDKPYRLAYVIAAAAAVGLAITLMGAVVGANADERFFLVPCPWLDSLASERILLPYLLALVLAFPTAWACYWSSGPVSEEMDEGQRKLGLYMGIGLTVFLLAAVYLTRTRINGTELESFLLWLVALLPEKARLGFLLTGAASPTLAPGHLTLFCFLLISTAVYVIGLPLFRPTIKKDPRQLPAIAYVLGLIQIFSLIFGGLAFVLDFYRIPILLSFLAFSALCYTLWKVDHYYELQKSTAPKPEPEGMLKALKTRLAGQDTLVVVCASGGGIQAAGWTTQVLCGLQKELGEEFTKAIGLISAVSGGSVGTLYFLDRFGAGGFPAEQDLDTIFQAATHNSLSGTGWGLVYPDLWRFIGLPFLKTSPSDRGQAIDTVWKSQMHDADTKFGDWRKRIEAGELPIPVFNATLVEDGRPYLLTPITFGITKEQGVEFNTLYGGLDIDASSAALLSATFPYVTPITRNTTPMGNEQIFHVADGGYFDNFGVVTAVDWLDELVLPECQSLGIKNVLIVEIKAFPDPDIMDSAGDNPVGWPMALLGPALTIVNARNSTQNQRNQRSIAELIEEWNKKNGLSLQKFEISFPKEIEFFSLPQTGRAKIDRYLSKLATSKQQAKRYNPPLSWTLTKKQRESIVNAWTGLVKNLPDGELGKLVSTWKAIKEKAALTKSGS